MCSNSCSGEYCSPTGFLLTAREIEEIQKAAEGKTAKESAIEAGLSKKTVETHLHNARIKTYAHNTAHLVAIAIRNGLISSICAISAINGIVDQGAMRPARGGSRIVRVSRSRLRRRDKGGIRV